MEIPGKLKIVGRVLKNEPPTLRDRELALEGVLDYLVERYDDMFPNGPAATPEGRYLTQKSKNLYLAEKLFEMGLMVDVPGDEYGGRDKSDAGHANDWMNGRLEKLAKNIVRLDGRITGLEKTTNKEVPLQAPCTTSTPITGNTS